MTIALVIVTIVILSCFCSKRYIKAYFVFAAFALSVLYILARPSPDDDYYRGIAFLRTLRDISWLDILTMQEKNYGYSVTNLYIPRYPVFCIYSKIMSYFPEHLYVVPVCFVIYLLPLRYMRNEMKRDNRGAYIFAYSFYLLCINYVSISAIRNVFVATMFCYLLYIELVEQKNRILCWIGYGLLCLIHAYGFILLSIRMLVAISNKYTKYLISAAALLAYGIVVNRAGLITQFLQRMGGSGIAALLNAAVTRGAQYATYTSDDRWKLKMASLFFYIVYSLFIVSYYRKSVSIKEKDARPYRRLLEYFAYLLLFTLSAYSQIDTFARGDMFLTPLTGIFVMKFLDEFIDFRSGRIVCKRSGAVFPFLLIVTIMAGLFAYRIHLPYRWANSWWG